MAIQVIILRAHCMDSKHELEMALEIEDNVLAPGQLTVWLVRKKKRYARN